MGMPERWRGANVLGWALMEARDCLASGSVRHADGTLDLTACRAYARQMVVSFATGLKAVADVTNRDGVGLLLKVVGKVLVEPKACKLKDDGVRKRCGDCYNDVAVALKSLGFVLDESVWIYSADTRKKETLEMLRGAQSYLVNVV